MKRILFLFFVVLFWGCKATDTNTQASKIIIPLYLYDTKTWDYIAKFKSKEIVILNPSNGPGDEIDKNYQNLINELISNKNKPIGYVYTKWGDRNITEVKNDINRWLEFYPNIQGFFIDEASENINDIEYYRNLFTFIKSKGDYYVVLNPGVYPDEKYFDISDSIVVFEDDINRLSNDVCNKNFKKSSIIVYDANESQMREILLRYKCKNFYVTDDTLPNPYDTVPSYFEEEIKLLK